MGSDRCLTPKDGPHGRFIDAGGRLMPVGVALLRARESSESLFVAERELVGEPGVEPLTVLHSPEATFVPLCLIPQISSRAQCSAKGIGNEGGGSAIDNIVTARGRPHNGDVEARPCPFQLR